MKPAKKAGLLSGSVTALYMRYLFSSVTASVMIALNYFIDTLCIGQKLGEAGLSALSIASPAAGLLYALGFLFGMGGSTLFSASLGRGKKTKAQGYYTLSLLLLLCLSVLLGAMGTAFLGPLASFLGGGGISHSGTVAYLRYLLPFAPVFCLETFFSVFTSNDRAPGIAMGATLISCLANSVLDVYFVFVLEWGMAGASLATSLATALGLALLAAGALRKASNLRLRRAKQWRRAAAAVLRTGLPSFVQQLTPSLVALTFNNVLLVISGELSVAVYGVISNVGVIVSSALNGAGEAMQPIVSANAGAEKQYRVRQVLRIAFLSTLVLAAALVLLCELCTRPIVGIFIDAGSGFMAMALPGLRITALSYLAVAVNVLLTAYFQSVKAGGAALLLSLVRGVALPVASVLFCALFFGVNGVWASIVLSEALALGVALFCLRRVQTGLRIANYQRLKYFSEADKVEDTLDGILYLLGAEELSAFVELIEYCNSRDEDIEGTPAYIGLDDLTSDYEGDYQCAEADEGYGLWLALGALLFTDLFEQNEEYMREKLRDLNYPAAAPAMSALAEKCFRFEYDEKSEKTTVVTHRGTLGEIPQSGGGSLL